MPKYIDIHSHVQFEAFENDKDEVIRRALESDTWMINVGTQKDTSRRAIETAHEYSDGVYAIVGLHPIHTGASYHDVKELGEGGKEFTSRGEIFDKNIYREFLKDPKVLGVGECGLDYYRMDEESVEKQRKAFIEQIELANEVDKPMMLHIRTNKDDKIHNAYFDALELIKKYAKVKGDVHCFTGNWDEAKGFVDFGFTISFTGIITFAKEYEEVVRNIPLDMIMTETDCPYLTPAPHRGKRNEPVYVREVVKRIAEIKGLPEGEVAEAIVANTKRVFGI